MLRELCAGRGGISRSASPPSRCGSHLLCPARTQGARRPRVPVRGIASRRAGRHLRLAAPLLDRARVLRVQAVGAHQKVEQHDVLAVVRVWDGVVRVVRPHAEDGDLSERQPQRREVDARVVEGGESAAEDEEEDAGEGVHGHGARDEVEGEEVVVLTRDELERVDVDGVRVTACWHQLPVVVLVHVRVDRAVVQCAVEDGVKGVIHQEEGGEGEEDARRRELCRLPQHTLARRHELQEVERHHHDGDLAARYVQPVDPLQRLERLAARRQLIPRAEELRHAMPVKLEPYLRQHPEHEHLGRAPVERVQEAMARARDEQWEQPVSPPSQKTLLTVACMLEWRTLSIPAREALRAGPVGAATREGPFLPTAN
eukprot:CAMPEP_0185355826 /NCGR_PEP_ID=MMETSP1364-20130426/6284_1 /TAXON_ID=38817 /ORGANISM="Gephyrocapsa oceanica, Strain RCC1303" /LENGTH=370 /DNA_ID=CAMNT_0027955689 /DNA_START=164 /DNA_END=1274 /DNA_ORIENTATION=+